MVSVLIGVQFARRITTHGFKTLAEAACGEDVATLVESGWVAQEAFPKIPTVEGNSRFVSYGPLSEASSNPDIVFLFSNGKQAMMLHDAWPEIRFEGKPQCHVIPIAKEAGEIAVSVGCMLSRVRTGMSNNEITCAIPYRQLPALLQPLSDAIAANKKVAAYASQDRERFTT